MRPCAVFPCTLINKSTNYLHLYLSKWPALKFKILSLIEASEEPSNNPPAVAGEQEAPPKSPRGRKRKTDDKELNKQDTEEESSDSSDPKSNGVQIQNRNISCLSDANAAGSSQREVVVECFAPYDDHRWVNIGKILEIPVPK